MTHKPWYLPLCKGGIIPLALLHSYVKPHIHLPRAQGHEDENLQVHGKAQADRKQGSEPQGLTHQNTCSHFQRQQKPLSPRLQPTLYRVFIKKKKKRKKLETHILNSKVPTYNYLPLLFKYTMWPKWNFSISWTWPVSLGSALCSCSPFNSHRTGCSC